MLDRNAKALGGKRGAAVGAPYQKVKVKRQIVAITISNQVETIISADNGLTALAKQAGLKVKKKEDLPLRRAALQQSLYSEPLATAPAEPATVPAKPAAVADPIAAQEASPPSPP